MKNQIKALLIVAFLVLSIATPTILLPATDAHSPAWQVPTYAFINVAPNPAGLGQTVTVNFWLDIPPPTANGVYGDRWGNYSLKVTKPDGTTETLGPFTADDTGGTWTPYTPTQLGNYTFVFSFPGQTLSGSNLSPGATNAYVGDYFMPSTSAPATLSVQENPIGGLSANPLPSTYWTRPVQSTNSPWYTITGNWLGLGITSFGATGRYNATGDYNPYTTSPKTAHILWTKPAAFGGLIGGEFGGTLTSNFYSTAEYEPKFAPIILNGVLYYEQYPGSSTNPVGWTAVDLRTGQTLWTFNTTQVLRCGQLLNYVSPNQFGAFGYLWSTGPPPPGLLTIAATSYSGTATSYTTVSSANTFTGTNYNMYDAMTGSFILSIVNGTAMTLTEDDNGNLIGYYVNSSTANVYKSPTLNMWNSSQAILYPNGQPTGFASWLWRPPQGAFIQFSAGIVWSKPIATNISDVSIPTLGLSNSILGAASVNSGVVLLTAAASAGLSTGYQPGSQIEAGYDANTGAQLWITNRSYTPASRLQLIAMGNGMYVYINLATATAFAYNLRTGAQIWTTTIPNANPYDSSGGYEAVLTNGVLYTWGFGGDVLAFNMADGKILWQTSTTILHGDPGTDTPYGVWPLWTFTVGTIADGVLYIPEGHQYSPPLFRGAHQLAINITNGQKVWDILGFDVTTAPAISDGIMTTLNSYDNLIYAYGKGPSKITVSAPRVGVTTSTPIVIGGTITDESAGAQQLAIKANYPDGLPCVSDASMTNFMEGIYMQQQMPHNITGVPISIDVMDSNGNYRNIGTTTSTSLGTWSYTWTPDIAGDYAIYATFPGTESYYSSTTEAAIHALEPAATPTSPPSQAPSMADQYLVPGIISIIIAIVIVGAILALLVTRKQP